MVSYGAARLLVFKVLNHEFEKKNKNIRMFFASNQIELSHTYQIQVTSVLNSIHTTI